MDISGEQRIAASREQVWAALNNPNVLKKCIPGCETVERTSPTEMVATVKVKVGPISSSFKANLVLTDVNAPESYTLSTEGSGGLAGFVKGSTEVHLKEESDETLLTYATKAQIGGKLALLGSRMINASSKKLAAQFFERLGKIVAKRAEASAPSEA